ncbi:zinc finger SWIM domain-containing protein 7 [Silurus asotus]|uniref:Zinc finger SWIM domain-containing protein 7 n=1 Tax=Silurus asotus TaxID=30991 RepID=A0AAD5A267_SILAS|nr:zinc finger SWIM domain-containing protein 7 [Silurus asotus]
MASCLPAVAEQLLKDLHKTYLEKSQNTLLSHITPAITLLHPIHPSCTLFFTSVTHSPLLCTVDPRLRFIFGSCTLQALDLVDQRAVTSVSSPSGRVVFQVLGGSGRVYTCYTSCHYCPCPAFSFSVLRRNESLVMCGKQTAVVPTECKHILAVYLCQAMGLCQQEQVSDQHMTLILSGRTELDP